MLCPVGGLGPDLRNALRVPHHIRQALLHVSFGLAVCSGSGCKTLRASSLHFSRLGRLRGQLDIFLSRSDLPVKLCASFARQLDIILEQLLRLLHSALSFVIGARHLAGGNGREKQSILDPQVLVGHQ